MEYQPTARRKSVQDPEDCADPKPESDPAQNILILEPTDEATLGPRAHNYHKAAH